MSRVDPVVLRAFGRGMCIGSMCASALANVVLAALGHIAPALVFAVVCVVNAFVLCTLGEPADSQSKVTP